MDYALATDESIDEGIKRIYTDRLQQIIPTIRPPHQNLHEAIHDARRGFKFMRALIRLIKFSLEPEAYEQQNHMFRDMGRFVSELRDLHVFILLMQYVARESHSVRPQDIEEGLNILQQQEKELLEEARDQHRFEDMADRLEEVQNAFTEQQGLPDQQSLLFPGLKEIYKKGRENYFRADEEGTKEQFHEWRKQVKYFMNAFQVLAHFWPGKLDIKGKSLAQLSDYLGEEHDLALLDDLLVDQDFRRHLGNIKAMRSYVDQKRSFLQRSALNLGGFIYSKTEEEFISFFN
ncbi:CHAD domain-containing protein [Halalkalibaculum sp. DA3122]|uniref:CHAD domain-containing protein n=1 Tax=Halalkalibaculum sp. DA3122 TaxID=3373607 RepID=UPI003754E34E